MEPHPRIDDLPSSFRATVIVLTDDLAAAGDPSSSFRSGARWQAAMNAAAVDRLIPAQQ